MSVDEEVDRLREQERAALNSIIAALAPFDKETQQRVLETAAVFYELNEVTTR